MNLPRYKEQIFSAFCVYTDNLQYDFIYQICLNDSVSNYMGYKTFKLPQVKIYQANKTFQAQHGTHVFDSTIVMILFFYSENFFLFSMILESQVKGNLDQTPKL